MTLENVEGEGERGKSNWASRLSYAESVGQRESGTLEEAGA